MKYIATIAPTGAPVGGGQTHEIEIDEEGALHIDGRTYHADLQRIGKLDLYSLLLNNKSFEVHVQETERNGYRVMVSSQGYEGYEVRVLDERTYRASQVSGALAGGASDFGHQSAHPRSGGQGAGGRRRRGGGRPDAGDPGGHEDGERAARAAVPASSPPSRPSQATRSTKGMCW
ncbi:MAG: hypothetical protein V9H69_26880 [Anaerolineae bacterium]